MSTHDNDTDTERIRQIQQSDHESQALERSDAAKVAAVAALVDDSRRNHMEDEAGAHVVYVWEVRKALADPDAALARVRAETRAEHRRDWADWIEHHDEHVGSIPLTVEDIVSALRWEHPPFGKFKAVDHE